MKDKRTYIKHKEHGEDMSHENERKHVVNPSTHTRNLASVASMNDYVQEMELENRNNAKR